MLAARGALGTVVWLTEEGGCSLPSLFTLALCHAVIRFSLLSLLVVREMLSSSVSNLSEDSPHDAVALSLIRCSYHYKASVTELLSIVTTFGAC